MATPPIVRTFDGEIYELWTGEYGPEPEGHTKPVAQKYARQIRADGYLARVVPYGRKYFVYFQ